MSTPSHEHQKVADELARRIAALIPANPQILEMTDPWGLFEVPGFRCDDLGPTMAQASWALCRAKAGPP